MLITSNNWLIGGLFIATASFSLSAKSLVSSEKLPIRDNVGFLLLPLWVHSICIRYFDFKRDPNAWTLSLDIKLISVVYSVSKLQLPMLAFSFWQIEAFVQAWCIWRKGLVFVATLLLPSLGSFSLGMMVKKE
ncbi:WAT1-related protein isoform X2 [Gossypium australe]|uniref:WAT1-related protein isoform X2 n=1 Tax=Gossypium australe TaxID=47621 RepID=A0A5B6X2S5_9ROSI|nr:WAT1-related protein isoform X2 [Gossypium australe]